MYNLFNSEVHPHLENPGSATDFSSIILKQTFIPCYHLIDEPKMEATSLHERQGTAVHLLIPLIHTQYQQLPSSPKQKKNICYDLSAHVMTQSLKQGKYYFIKSSHKFTNYK